MGKLFAGLGVTKDMEEVKERVGGGRHFFDTDVYENIKLKLAFTGKSDSGARYVTVVADIDGVEYEETIYITNSKGENFYMKDGKKNQMPGFVTINELCLTVTGEELEDQETEERQIEVYSYEDQKKVRQARDVLVGFVGAEASLAIRKATQPKTKKTDRVENGKPVYEDTDEDVTINEIVKSFHPETRATVGEIRKAAKDEKEVEAKFIDDWKAQWAGKVTDKRKGGKGTSKGASDGAPPKATAEKPKSSLFKKD